MSKSAYITPELFKFFEDLKKNNNRDWFQKNKKRFEREVQLPLLSFIDDFRIPLRSISPYLVADSRKVGGSLFRIYRDVRFSHDKSPYKTAAGIQFRHESGKDVHCPGLYLHLEPSGVFVALGIWHPDNPTLLKIRNAIVAEADHWRAATSNSEFVEHFTLGGDSLMRAPKGFDPDHPLIDDLRRKDFIASKDLAQEETYTPDFTENLARIWRSGRPLMKFLAEALNIPY